MIAWPADYEKTGVMTLLLNHYGDVYQKDLGPKTETLAPAISKSPTRLEARSPIPANRCSNARTVRRCRHLLARCTDLFANCLRKISIRLSLLSEYERPSRLLRSKSDIGFATCTGIVFDVLRNPRPRTYRSSFSQRKRFTALILIPKVKFIPRLRKRRIDK
jgi:hypothetical protein